jgi:predicted nucleotidyltransferase component of viral defense system
MKNIPASIHARLANEAQKTRKPFNDLLQHYGMERFLYRLSRTEYADRFILKGGLIFTAWEIERRRATRDIDFLGSLERNAETIAQILCTSVAFPAPEDGLFFDANTIQVTERLVDVERMGISANLLGYLGKAEIPIHIDIGFSDEILSSAKESLLPALLSGMERPLLKGYSPEFVVSEKLHAMNKYVEAPSRWKDYYDVWLISEYFEFDVLSLREAFITTFNNRSTKLPSGRPACLSADFALKYQAGWQSFLKKNALQTNVDNLSVLTDELWKFLETPLVNPELSPDKKWNPARRKWE